MTEPELLTRVDGPVLTVTLNRPDKLNAINRAMEQGLERAIEQFENDEALVVMLIAANGRFFSAGYDVDYRVDDRHETTGVYLRQEYREIHDLFDRFERVEKPVVVAAHGPCLGGALELALSCDFRLASDGARFGLPEITLAAIPGSGGTSRLTRLAGPAAARWLVMAGQQVDAIRAREMGIVQEVYPADAFDESVRGFVEGLARLPSEAMALAKLTIKLCDELDLSSARDAERLANTLLLKDPAYHQRVQDTKARIRRDLDTRG